MAGQRVVATIPVRCAAGRERRRQSPRRRISDQGWVGSSRGMRVRMRLEAANTAIENVFDLAASHGSTVCISPNRWMRLGQVVSGKTGTRVERRNAFAARTKAVATREFVWHVRCLSRRSRGRSGSRAAGVRIELSSSATLARSAGRDRRLNRKHTERRKVVVRTRTSRRLHIRVGSVSVRAMVAHSRLMSGTLVGVVVVGRRVTVTVTRVVDWRSWTGSVRTVGHRVATKEAHVAQRTKDGTAAGSPVRVAVSSGMRCTRGGCERQTGPAEIIVERCGVLGLGGVVVTVKVVIGREARRVLDAAWDAGGSGGPSSGTVMRTVLVVAVEAGRWVAPVVGTVRRAGVTTLGSVSI